MLEKTVAIKTHEQRSKCCDKIIFFGHHKCGSRYFRLTIFAKLAEQNGFKLYGYNINNREFHFDTLHDLDLMNIDFSVLENGKKVAMNISNAGIPVVDEIHRRSSEFRGVHVIRDPRQILASSYFHHIAGHPLTNGYWVWDKLARDRTILEKLDREDGILYELDNITRDIFENQIFPWKNDNRVLELKLEDFDVDIYGNMRRICDFLGLVSVPYVVTTDSTKQVNPSSAHWSDVFTPKIKSVFKERYGQKLIDLGYEKGFDW